MLRLASDPREESLGDHNTFESTYALQNSPPDNIPCLFFKANIKLSRRCLITFSGLNDNDRKIVENISVEI